MLALLYSHARILRIQTNKSLNSPGRCSLSNKIKISMRHMSRFPPISHEYFNPQRAEELHIRSSDKNHMKVKCYFNGMYWICPNPKDNKRASYAHKKYLEGHYFICTTYNIPIKDFENEDNWNS